MPATATELGVGDRFDPQANLQGGAAYLARQLQRFGDLLGRPHAAGGGSGSQQGPPGETNGDAPVRDAP